MKEEEVKSSSTVNPEMDLANLKKALIDEVVDLIKEQCQELEIARLINQY